MWVPFETPNVFHCPSYIVVPGLGVESSAPMFTVSSLNWTPTIPLVVWPCVVGSEAEAERVTVAERVELAVGEVREMVGGVVSGEMSEVKEAETDLFAFMVRVQDVSVPVQSPDQEENW